MSTPTRRPTRNAALAHVNAVNWHQHKACTPDDFDLFMSDAPADHEEAKGICAMCPAREFCLQFALEKKVDFGVFGGLGPNERMKLRGCRPRYQSDRESQWQRAIQDHAAELLALREACLPSREIGRRLGMQSATVNRALRELDDRAALDAASEAVAS
jgi:WhiB family redox-sensing transcriptional regulator